MRVIGILVEYNPAQNGHEYQISVAKEIYHADKVILIMSGNFNERGLPGIMPKEDRAKHGIAMGADIVIELPLCYSVADISGMALGAIDIFHKLGIVDYMLFGSESGELNELYEMANIMKLERYQQLYQEIFKSTGRASVSRIETLNKMGHTHYANIVNNPNNLLGTTFVSFLQQYGGKIKPLTHKRIGQAYLDDKIDKRSSGKIYSSATAVRRSLYDEYNKTKTVPENLKYCVPAVVYNYMKQSVNKNFPMFSDDFYRLIAKKIRAMTIQELSGIVGMSSEIALISKEKENLNFDEMKQLLKEKYPNKNFERIFFRILTNQNQEDYNEYVENGVVFYVKVLAYNVGSEELLNSISENMQIPLLMPFEKEHGQLSELGKKQYEYELLADKIYYGVLKRKFERG